jgi:hypothetical protein
MQRFLRDRLEWVKSLCEDHESHATIHDLYLILTAIMSACAANRFPFKGFDKNRFIELLVMYSPPEFHTSWISVPALINDGLLTEADTPYGAPGHSTRIFCDEEIDQSYDNALARYFTIPRKTLVKYSYAALIYELLRCGYAHQYMHDETITPAAPTKREARVSYISGSSHGKVSKRANFHFDYLFRLAEYHVENWSDVAADLPATWWYSRSAK